MGKIITNNAQMKCTLGAMPKPLKVTSQKYVQDSGQLVATEGDVQPMTNIPSFGTCKRVWYNPPCIPATSKWSSVSKLSTISGKKKLLISSTCKCQNGGDISFVDTGSNKHVDSQ